MPYVERNKDKIIFATYNRPQPGRAEEFLPDDDPEIVEFLKEPEPGPSETDLLKERVNELEKGAGEQESERGFSSRIDELEDRIAKLEG